MDDLEVAESADASQAGGASSGGTGGTASGGSGGAGGSVGGFGGAGGSSATGGATGSGGTGGATGGTGGATGGTGGATGGTGGATGGTGGATGGTAGATGGSAGSGGCVPNTDCAGACNAMIPDGCGGLIDCGQCPFTGISCYMNACAQMAVTNCIACPTGFKDEVATIPNVACGAGCASPGTMKVCAKDVAYFTGVHPAPGGCPMGSTFTETIDDCAGKKHYVCVLE